MSGSAHFHTALVLENGGPQASCVLADSCFFFLFVIFLYISTFIATVLFTCLKDKIKTFNVSEDGYLESLIYSNLYFEHLLFSTRYNLANIIAHNLV